jgi:hypothetical protein
MPLLSGRRADALGRALGAASSGKQLSFQPGLHSFIHKEFRAGVCAPTGSVLS